VHAAGGPSSRARAMASLWPGGFDRDIRPCTILATVEGSDGKHATIDVEYTEDHRIHVWMRDRDGETTDLPYSVLAYC
jgi:hypothetical protein